VRIAVIALDTRGGVQPYTALALGLRRAGHDVRLLAPADAVPGIAARGLEAVGLSGPSESDVRGAGGVAELGTRERNRLMRSRRAETADAARQALAACADVDLLTGGVGGMVLGVGVAEKLGRPFVEAHLQPLGPPTSAFPGPLVALPGWLGAPGRRLSHRLTTRGVDLMLGATARQARTEVLGLPARPAPPRPGLPVLYGYSPLVVPPAPEWGPERHVTGYWTLPDGDGWTPPPALAAFLAAGPPPVAVGFGSMVGRDPAALAALVVEAVRRAGVRAVLLSGWGGLDAAGLAGDDVLALDQAPHDWLFPRCAAVVHHGGAGTTGAALRAGVPAVVVPFGVDQPFWASRVVALGTGPAPVPRRRLTVDALAAALRTATTDEAVRERAADLGTRIRAEDGVGAAVTHYDALAAALARAEGGRS
jgi:UDP:flavonoid glycosyltransferase YjiC (YdhE family)